MSVYTPRAPWFSRSRFGAFLLLTLASVVTAATGCHPATQPTLNYAAQLPPGTLALRKIPQSMYPDFAANPADMAAVHVSINHSLDYLAKPSSQTFYPYADITHDRAVATLKALDEIALSAMAGQLQPSDIASRIVRDFEVYQSVGAPSEDAQGYTGKVLFTGYFTPTYAASLSRTDAFRWPLYKRPADLISDPITGQVQGRKTNDGQIVPYYTRAQIENGQSAGQELCWLGSRWEAYVVTVQGSGRLKLPDGSIYEVGYAGNNGYPYTSAAQQMVADGVLDQNQVSLRGMKAYFDQHPDQMDKYLFSNQRTVFFAQRPGGPYGKLNVPVTPMASIATDKENKDIYPRALAAFLELNLASESSSLPFRGFLVDQDTGGAIRAAGRCDIYMGVGDQAEQRAGRQLSEGRLFYVAIKPELVGKYLVSAP